MMLKMVLKFIENRGLKIELKMLKFDPKSDVYNRCHGGVENHQKSSFFGPGGPEGSFYKLFEILQFSTKTVQISTPKIDPIK
jgi:hypothetical protein